MKLYLYQLSGDKRYLNKNPFIKSLGNAGDPQDQDGAYYFGAEMMEDTSVIDPIFTLSYHEYWRSWTTMTMCNYLWCEDTLRWYYVTDVTLSKNRVYMKCHVDVLMTYREQIKKKNVIVKRTNSYNNLTKTSRYNLYLQDDKFKAYAPECERVIAFPEDKGFSSGIAEFVMCVVGNTQNDEQEGGD